MNAHIGLLFLLSSSAAIRPNCSDNFDLDTNKFLPPVKVIFNSSDAQANDFVCLLQRLGNVEDVYETESDHCVQLFTVRSIKAIDATI